MSDKMRWRYGETNPVVAAVDADTVIEIGDLLWQDTDDAKPAAAVPDQGSAPANQTYFADRFLGVAMQRSRAGESTPVRVATTGVFEMDCQAATFELGDLVAPAEGTSNVLDNQRVVKVSDPAASIARVARREPQSATSTLVDIRSTVMTGGVKGTT